MMTKNEQIIFILTSAEQIKKQLSNLYPHELEVRNKLISKLFDLDFEIKKFNKKDVELALQSKEYKKAKIRKSREQEQPQYKQEDDFFCWLVVFLIMLSKSKHKLFLLIVADIFLKDNKNEYRR